MKLNLSIWPKLLILVLIPLVFEVGFALVLAGLLEQAEEQSDQYEQSKEVLIQFNVANRTLVHTMTRIVTDSTSTASEKEARIDKAIAEVRQAIDLMQSSGRLIPELESILRPAPAMFESAIAVVQKSRQDFASERPSLAQLFKIRKVGMPILQQVNQLNRDLLAEESRFKGEAPAEIERTRRNVFVFLLSGLAVSVLISVTAAWFFFQDILRRLEIIKNNAHLLAIRMPISGTVSGGDELSKLNSALQRAQTMLEEARRKELSILDGATDLICSTDRRFRITAIGAASFVAWGYKPDDLLGRSILSLQTKECEAPVKFALESLASGKDVPNLESKVLCADNSVRDFSWKVNWSEDNQTFYCVAHDVTEKRTTERMKQRFVAIVGHDLRTPLSSISATFSLLLANAALLSETAHRLLAKAETNLERLMDLIRDLLDLEKLEAGKVVIEFGAVSALDVCNAACDSIEHLALKFQINLKRPHHDRLLHGDERRLTRVMINLISNAVKFSPKGSTVEISIADNDRFVELSVSDRGPGLSAVEQIEIFEKFRQSKIESSEIKGSGLGLTISKLIVDAHGGEIGVQSELGKGSRFYVRIPRFDEGAE